MFQEAPRPVAGVRWGIIGDGVAGTPEVTLIAAQAVALAEELERDLIDRACALQAAIAAARGRLPAHQEGPARAPSVRALGTPCEGGRP